MTTPAPKNCIIIAVLLGALAVYVTVLFGAVSAPACRPGAADDLHIDRMYTGCRR